MGKIEETNSRKEKTSKDLDRLCDKFSADIHSVAEAIGNEWTEDLSKQIVNFSNAAIQQTKEKVEVQTRKHVEEFLSLADMEKAKSIKGLEAFLSTSPLRLLDRVISVKLLEGAYSASARLECYGDIGYEFLLDSKSSNLFGKELRLSEYTKSEIKIPVRMAKSWMKKEPVFDYVRLDQHILTSAEATDSTLITNYSDAGGNSKIEVVYSRRDGSNPFLTVEYSDGVLNVNISSNPSLSSRLDVETISNNMERIWLGMNDLEQRKTALVKLTYRQKDILENLDASEFFDECWSALAPKISAAIRKTSIDSRARTSPEGFEEKAVRERLKLLGRQGESILSTIGLASN